MSCMALQWTKDLNLVYNLIPMWNSSMEPSGHMGLKSYFFFWFLCILTVGCNSNSSSNHGQWLLTKIKRYACTSSLMKPCHARRLVSRWHIHCWQWVCQNYQCQVAQKARSTMVCHAHSCESCCAQSLSDIKYQVTKWCHVWKEKSCFGSPVVELLWWW